LRPTILPYGDDILRAPPLAVHASLATGAATGASWRLRVAAYRSMGWRQDAKSIWTPPRAGNLAMTFWDGAGARSIRLYRTAAQRNSTGRAEG
jgi:hypothetical protein